MTVQQTEEDFLICNDDRCILLAEDFKDEEANPSATAKFNRVLADLTKVYPSAILAGAVAAAKYVRNPDAPRETEDLDVLLDEKDFAEFLIDEIPQEKLEILERHFETSDSASHSLKHKETGIYVDLISTQSTPIRKKISRYILKNRTRATHILFGGNHNIDVLKPELILAMKVNRHCKDPKTAKGISDYLDIVKLIKTLREKQIEIDHDAVRSFLNRREKKQYDAILEETGPEANQA